MWVTLYQELKGISHHLCHGQLNVLRTNGKFYCNNVIVNLHRSTRTNEYVGMQMFLTTNLKRDWSAYFNTYLLSKTKTGANENLICINSLHPVYHTRQLNMDYVQGS